MLTSIFLAFSEHFPYKFHPSGQHLAARFGDQHRVLELRRALPVRRGHRPAVGPGDPLGGALGEHRLDGEGGAQLHLPGRVAGADCGNRWEIDGKYRTFMRFSWDFSGI